MIRKIIYVLSIVAIAPAAVWAEGSIDTAKVREVLNYYHQGDTATLVEYKFCSGIVKEGENKNECEGEIDGSSIAAGSKAYLWMNFMIPGDDTEKANILVQYKYKGLTMDTNTLTMPQSIRYRTWRIVPTRKSGDWEVSVQQENESGFTAVETLSYKVVDAAGSAEAM